jgi:gamma-glutamyltranspeptidase/glutathione hydrolase
MRRARRSWLGGTPGGDYQPQWNLQTITGLMTKDWMCSRPAKSRVADGPCHVPCRAGEAFSLVIEDRVGEETLATLEAWAIHSPALAPGEPAGPCR